MYTAYMGNKIYVSSEFATAMVLANSICILVSVFKGYCIYIILIMTANIHGVVDHWLCVRPLLWCMVRVRFLQ